MNCGYPPTTADYTIGLEAPVLEWFWPVLIIVVVIGLIIAFTREEVA
jgi:cytochrome c-type biogenesis protein CcmH/NrfF